MCRSCNWPGLVSAFPGANTVQLCSPSPATDASETTQFGHFVSLHSVTARSGFVEGNVSGNGAAFRSLAVLSQV